MVKLARELEKPEVTPAKMNYAQLVKQYLLDHDREPVRIGELGRHPSLLPVAGPRI